MSNPILVEVTRDPLVESVHRGAFAVSDAKGRLRLQAGDVERPIFPRSSLKPVQAVPLIETGAAEAFGVTDEELALACASHSGEPMHTTRVAQWQERIGCSVADLACGPHRPVHEKTATEMIVTRRAVDIAAQQLLGQAHRVHDARAPSEGAGRGISSSSIIRRSAWSRRR